MPSPETQIRRYTFKLYPNREQLEALERQRRMHCDLYNALVQQRIEAYRRGGKTLSYYDQCKELTALRNDTETASEWSALSSCSMQATAQRVNRAFNAFFDRARKGMGHQSGFPRFKPGRTFPGFSFKKHGSGWNLRWKNGKGGDCYFQAVPGRVKFRGRLPSDPEKITTCELLWREERWWLSLVVEMSARRRAGYEDLRVEFDLIDSFARVSRENGGRAAGPDDETLYFVSEYGRIIPQHQRVTDTSGPVPSQTEGDHGVDADAGGVADGPVPSQTEGDYGQVERRVGELQAARARCKRGSCKYRKLSKQIARCLAKSARRRREEQHRWTTSVAREASTITVVIPVLSEATKSGRGYEKNHGANVQLKADVNKQILGQCAYAVASMLEYKITEAGGTFTKMSTQDAAAYVGNDAVRAKKSVRRLTRAARKAA